MDKKIVILFYTFWFSLIISEVVFALDHSTYINQDESWYPADNPHNIVGVIGVISNATLTINPGVEVRFNTGCSLFIGRTGSNPSPGKLIASGTDTQNIIFTSNTANPQAGDWNSISFNASASDDSIIENAIIEYGGGGSIGSLSITDVSPTVRNCIVRYSGKSGIELNNSGAEISNCNIESNANYGLDSDGFFGVLDGNHFAYNENYPIRLYLRNTQNPVVNVPNTFVSNNPDKVFFTPSVTSNYTLVNFGIPYAFLSNIIVSNNATLTIDPGVEIDLNTGCSLFIGSTTPGKLIVKGTNTDKVKFTSNFSTPQPGDWNWIGFNSKAANDSVIENAIIEYGRGISITGSNPAIRSCTIRHSATNGIELSSSSSAITCSDIEQNQIGIYASLSDPAIALNNISNNIDWGIYNTPSMAINTQYNWWGDALGPSGSGIGFGDAVSAYVNYQPWLTEKSDCMRCIGDFDSDGDVDGKNLSELTAKYGCSSNCGIYDLTNDGAVNSEDIGIFALFFGRNNCVQ